MALKDKLFALIDNTGLAERFSFVAPDPTKLRQPLLRGIENAKRQFDQGQTKAPNRWWRVSNDVVALTVKVGGDTFDINGVATNHFPAERFHDFMNAFKAAVEAGEFDEELANKGNGDAKVHIAKSGGTRQLGEQSRTNIRVSGWRRAANPKSDKDIRARLESEGVSKEVIDKALARKKA